MLSYPWQYTGVSVQLQFPVPVSMRTEFRDLLEWRPISSTTIMDDAKEDINLNLSCLKLNPDSPSHSPEYRPVVPKLCSEDIVGSATSSKGDT